MYLIQSANATNAKLDTALAELRDMKERVVEVETDLKHAFTEIFDLKEKINKMEQKDRSHTIRVFGLPLSEEEKEGSDPQKAAAKNVYDRLLRPILATAKDKGLISTLPHSSNVVVEAFRLTSKKSPPTASASPHARPPPILLKLVSIPVKTAIFKAKSSALPDPTETEKGMGIRRFHI
jgi:hypothetical protein